ncbi:hypothetical protein PoB_001158200 [Plakobranchus ocellatus]|uniref:Uncharacterized protein n=1 Tax=Plakobranchus ocellatus TaxID=259542 RepID=A0AAV3YRG5_9GAST|nr:hypothetical protein PoB_001158200 [Plakobranchus ocellatus]
MSPDKTKASFWLPLSSISCLSGTQRGLVKRPVSSVEALTIAPWIDTEINSLLEVQRISETAGILCSNTQEISINSAPLIGHYHLSSSRPHRCVAFDKKCRR